MAAAQGVQLQDYGHYDISYNNPQAPTPTLHALASEGVILNRHYVYQYCSPTRSSFLSGRLPIHVNTANHPTTELGGVDLRMQTVAEALKSAGYQVLHACHQTPSLALRRLLSTDGDGAVQLCLCMQCHTAGKWHAGGHLWGQLPTERGFVSAHHVDAHHHLFGPA